MSEAFEGSTRRHGTMSGYSLHRDRGQDACPACYEAQSAYEKRLRESTPKQERDRQNARAQSLANKWMRQAHPTEYSALYAAAKHEIKRRDKGAK